jgi:hypothetical protein
MAKKKIFLLKDEWDKDITVAMTEKNNEVWTQR